MSTTGSEMEAVRNAEDTKPRRGALGTTIKKLVETPVALVQWNAPEKKTLEVLADTLLAWDPKALHVLWKQGRLELNFTRLRELASALLEWREPLASQSVLAELARRSGRSNDISRADRYAQACAVLEPDGRDRVATDRLYRSDRDDVVIAIVDEALVPDLGEVGARTAVVQLDVMGNVLDAKEGVVGVSQLQSFADLSALPERLLQAVVGAVGGRNVLAVVTPSTPLGYIAGALCARELGAPIVRLKSSHTEAADSVERFARRLGLGQTPQLPAFRRSHTELSTLCIKWENAVAAEAVAIEPSTAQSPSLVTSEFEGRPVDRKTEGRPVDRKTNASSVVDRRTAFVVLLEELRERARVETRDYVRAATRALASSRVANPMDWFPARDNTVDELIAEGWKFAEFPPVPLELPISWDDLAQGNRSWNFQLHSWRFMDAAMNGYLQSGDRELLSWCAERAVSWTERFVDADPGEALAWYDMALGLRSARLSVLLWAAAREELGEDIFVALLALARAHAIEHSTSESFNPRSNHGFYAALGQSLLGRTLDFDLRMRDLAGQGAERLGVMLKQQFAEDGGHREHSPDYHRMVLGSFVSAMDAGLVSDPEVQRRIRRAAYVLGWFIQPNGEMLQFGDSPARDMTKAGNRVSDPHAKFIATDGRKGSAISQESLVLAKSGYVIIRSPQPSRPGARMESSYLALQAGFHSRTHKHADDLTVVWFDRGREILVDGGRYGYGDLLPANSPLRGEGHYYADPMRRYVESSLAHNTAMVGEVDHDRRREVYGVADVSTRQANGTHSVAGKALHEGWEHGRKLVLTPGVALRVEDTVEKAANDDRVATVIFNLAGDLTLDVETPQRIRVHHPSWEEPLVVTQLASSAELIEPVTGRESPLLGWRSKIDRRVEPTWNFGWRSTLAGPVTFITNFEFHRGETESSMGTE